MQIMHFKMSWIRSRKFFRVLFRPLMCEYIDCKCFQSPRGTITTQVYGKIPHTYNNPNMQQLCHSVTTNPILASLYRMLQRCPQRTTLSIFTESVWTEIVKYIHSPDLGRQIHKMGIWSLSQNGRLVKPISGMIYCSRGHFYLLIHTSSNRANRLTIVYFKGYAYNAYPKILGDVTI